MRNDDAEATGKFVGCDVRGVIRVAQCDSETDYYWRYADDQGHLHQTVLGGHASGFVEAAYVVGEQCPAHGEYRHVQRREVA